MYQWCRVVLTALIAICVSALAVAQSIERKPGTEIHANAYSEVTVQSYQECEQRCLADNTCTALEYYKEQPSKQCGLHSKVANPFGGRFF
jgi:PAN domain